MSETGLPDDVEAFIAQYIDSVVQLELLILLRGGSGERWTAEAVARELRIDAGWTAAELDRLAASGLVSATRGTEVRYGSATRTPELDAGVARLVQTYADRRVAVINCIYRPRPDAIRTFADAFRLRKD
jgi:hypothetical protein